MSILSALKSSVTALVLLTVIAMPVHATVTTIGDVDPGGAIDPWAVGGTLKVGNSGHGTLNVAAGGEVTNHHGYLGYYFGSTGEATVTGIGSQWNNSDNLWIGGNDSEAGGTGILNLYDSGLATVTNTTKPWGMGTLNLDGGSLTTGSFDNSEAGTFNFHDGTLTVNGAGGVFDPGVDDFTIDGNAADDAPHLVIANTASATLVGNLQVGNTRQGVLMVEFGSVVSNTHGSIGWSTGSTGEVTVSGTGSQWNNSQSLSVGLSGTGTLNVTDGGVVSNTHGYIGYESGSTGLTTVTGANSQWNNSVRLYVGFSGTGTLNVTDGGVVANTSGYIGLNSGSTGEATVTGSGSQWNNLNNLFVGVSGTGTLNVEAGGVVANNYGYIGYDADFTGEATITGTGSQWNNSLNLYVGYRGNGTLNIEDEGLVTVGGTTSVSAAGTVNLTGGRFEFGQTTLAEFSTINATSGSMAGDVIITGVNDVASLTVLQNPLVELNEVAAVNEGLLYGSAILKSSLDTGHPVNYVPPPVSGFVLKVTAISTPVKLTTSVGRWTLRRI